MYNQMDWLGHQRAFDKDEQVVKIANLIWDTNTLSWIKDTGGSTTVSSDVNVTNRSFPVSQSGAWSVQTSGAGAVSQSASWTVASVQSGVWTVQTSGNSGGGPASQSGSWSVGLVQPAIVINSGVVPVNGPLTDAQLRASAVPVSGTFFQSTQPVSGTGSGLFNVTGTFFPSVQPVSGVGSGLFNVVVSGTPVFVNSGSLTDSQLRASPVVVVGTVAALTGLVQPLTDTQLRASPFQTLSVQSGIWTVQTTGNSGGGPASQSGTWTVGISGFVVNSGVTSVTGPLTDSQLRALPPQVYAINSGPVAQTGGGPVSQSGSWSVGILGTVVNSGLVSVLGPLTDTQLRASPPQVYSINSGPVAQTGGGPVSQSGSWSVGITGVQTVINSGVVPVSGTFFQGVQPVSGANSGVFNVSQIGTWNINPIAGQSVAQSGAFTVTSNVGSGVINVQTGSGSLNIVRNIDRGRTSITLYGVAFNSGLSGVESIMPLSRASGSSAVIVGTSYYITPGRTLRLQTVSFSIRNNSSIVAAAATFSLRMAPNGNVIPTSTPILLQSRNAVAGVSFGWDRNSLPIEEGYDIVGIGSTAIGVTVNQTFTSAPVTCDVLITGFEY